MAQQYRYPGAKPFNTNESHVFYGRAGVSQDLYQLIRLESLVVLHAKSGLGKSSVINAGLLPIVAKNQEYDPYNIRFHAFTEGKQDFPLDITRNGVRSQSDLLDKIRPEGEDSLWYHLKSLQLAAAEGKGTLLIFDQFEELFTYEEEVVEEFARQLSEALYSTLPQRFRDQRKEGFEKNTAFLSEEELAQLDQPLNLRLLMVIRSDRMSLMKKLKAYFPTILSADFELQPLTREQAENAILSPAYQKAGFATPIFDYEDDAIEYLLDFLSEDGTEPIESFQLQILCEYVERHLVAQQGKTLIQRADIAQPDQILENYYLDKINAITDPTDQLAARRLIEEGFIFEEEERRLTLYEGQIFKSYGINQALLNQLLDTHLIRSEPSLRGGYTYELSHDTLVAPVLKAKAKRKAAERLVQEREQQQAREAELLALRQKEEAARQQAEQEKQLRTAAERNEKRAKQRTRLAVLISVLAIALSGLSFWLYTKAEESNALSEAKTEEALEAKKDAEAQKEFAISAQADTKIALDSAEVQRLLAEANEQKALMAQSATVQALTTAKTQQERAEAAAAAAQNASLALTIANKNPTLALRIAEYNMKKHPRNPVAVAAFGEVINSPDNVFYKEMGGHPGMVRAVSFSPDGKSILTGSSDGIARLWGLDGNELQAFHGHTSWVNAVSFSPDGRSILTGSSDKTAKLWNLQGNELQTFKGHSLDVRAVSFSPDGKSILTGSRDSTARLWGLDGNELQIFQGHSSSVHAVSFSPDGKSILTGSRDSTARLWGLDGNELQIFQGHSSSVHAVSFSPDGRSILTGYGNTSIFVFSEKNNRSVSGAKLWDLRGKELQSFSGHIEAVFAVAFSPDGQSILTGSWDKTAKLWDLTGNELQTLKGHSRAVSAASFSPDGKSILTGSWDGTTRLWGLQGFELQSFQGHTEGVTSVAFSPDGQSILTGSQDGTAKLWDLQSNKLQNIQVNNYEKSRLGYPHVTAVSFSPDGKNILTGSGYNANDESTVKLWDLQGNKLQNFPEHTSSVTAISFSPDGRNILTASILSEDTGPTILWDLEGNKLQNFKFETSYATAVAFSPDGQNILTGDDRGMVMLWNLQGDKLQNFQVHNHTFYELMMINAVSFSPDGKSILTGSKDGTLKLWDLQGSELQGFRGHPAEITSIAFSPNLQNILTVHWDKTAKLWDLKGNELQTFPGHTERVSAVSFSPDGLSILTGSADGTAKLWQTPQSFLDQKVKPFTLQELYDAGVILEAEDLEQVKE